MFVNSYLPYTFSSIFFNEGHLPFLTQRKEQIKSDHERHNGQKHGCGGQQHDPEGRVLLCF